MNVCNITQSTSGVAKEDFQESDEKTTGNTSVPYQLNSQPLPPLQSIKTIQSTSRTQNLKSRRKIRKNSKKSNQSLPKLVKILKCTICNLKFTSEILLKRHTTQLHSYQKPYKCDQCPEAFNVIENLTLHISIHNPDHFRCPQCGKIFNRLASLQGHIKTHFKSEYFLCTTCGEQFHYEAILKQHLLSVHPNENYHKQVERDRRAHERRQRRDTSRECSVCGKYFPKNFLLERHKRVHSQEKPYKCDKCPRAFTQKYSLVIHKNKHDGTKPYQCSECQQSFTQKGNLQVHIKRCHSVIESENGECIQHSCSQCSCSFKFKRTLNAHISRCHQIDSATVASGNSCDFDINHVMSQLSELNQPNLAAVNETQLQNPPALLDKSSNIVSPINTNCLSDPLINTPSNTENLIEETSNDDTVTFVQLTDDDTIDGGAPVQYLIERHSNGRTNYLSCPYCKRQFNRPADMIRHIRIHIRVKPYECEICQRNFRVKSTLKAHMATHSANNHLRYPCLICTRSLKTVKSLNNHYRKYHPDQLPPLVNASDLQGQYTIDESQGSRNSVTTDTFLIDCPSEFPSAENESYECDFCSKRFVRKDQLKIHIHGHMDSKFYQCSKCEKCFNKWTVLSRHLQNHAEMKPYSCNICSWKCATADKLKRHAQSHSTERSVICPYCDRAYKNHYNLKIHLKKHQQQPDSTFIDHHEKNQSDNLVPNKEVPESTSTVITSEIVQIDNEMPIQIVDAMYALDSNVILSEPIIIQDDTHSDQFDPNEYLIIFTQPNDQEYIQFEDAEPAEPNQLENISDFDQNSYDNAKISNNEQNNSEIQILQSDATIEKDIRSTEIRRLKERIKTMLQEKKAQSTPKDPQLRNHACDQCSKSFRKPIDLQRHLRTHTGERPYKCTVCSKAFSLLCTLNTHQKIHSTVKPVLPCHICEKQFATRHTLQVHMRIHAGLRPFRCEFCSLSFRTHGHRSHHMMAHMRAAARNNVEPNMVKTRMENGRMKRLMNAANLDELM